MTVDKGIPRRGALALAAAGLGDLAFFREHPASAAAGAGTGGTAAAGPALEALVRMIEQTPRDRLIEAAAEKIRAGAGYRDLLTATFLAGVRGIRARPVGFEFHCVLAVHSAHLAAEGGPAAERLVPVLWAMDNFKGSQETKARKGEGAWTLPAIDGARLPPAAQARRRYLEAMAAWDEEGADVAITALVRQTPPEGLRDLLFQHGTRDFRDLGHKAIYAANAWRTLQTIGWQHAELVLRSLTFACLDHEGSSPAGRDSPADRPGRENLERLGRIRPGWQEAAPSVTAVGDLLPVLRRSGPSDSAAAVAKMLNAKAGPASIWDALHLFAAELVMRHPQIVSLHAVTSVNALHQAYQAAGAAETRLLLLLQAAAFLPLFREDLDDDYKGGPRIDGLEPAPVQAGEAGLRQVFEAIDKGNESLPASRAALGWLGAGPGQAVALLAGARRLLFAKGRGAHDYKFSAAVLEDFQQVSPAYRNRYLAANVALLAGTREADNPLYARARSALG